MRIFWSAALLLPAIRAFCPAVQHTRGCSYLASKKINVMEEVTMSAFAGLLSLSLMTSSPASATTSTLPPIAGATPTTSSYKPAASNPATTTPIKPATVTATKGKEAPPAEKIALDKAKSALAAAKNKSLSIQKELTSLKLAAEKTDLAEKTATKALSNAKEKASKSKGASKDKLGKRTLTPKTCSRLFGCLLVHNIFSDSLNPTFFS